MWGKSKEDEVVTTNFKPTEPEVPEMIYPDFGDGTIVEHLGPNKESAIILDSRGDAWLATLKDGTLQVTPAAVTPREERDNE